MISRCSTVRTYPSDSSMRSVAFKPWLRQNVAILHGGALMVSSCCECEVEIIGTEYPYYACVKCGLSCELVQHEDTEFASSIS